MRSITYCGIVTLYRKTTPHKLPYRISNEYLMEIVRTLIDSHRLSLDDYQTLIAHRNSEVAALLSQEAARTCHEYYENGIYIRGLIEISNYCKNDCYYCGIRKSNHSCMRYRLTVEEILDCANAGYEIGFRTFVLQGGEDPWFNDERLVELISALHQTHPDCAITLSLGERTTESYERLFEAGAERYLLRHEAISAQLYRKLHPSEMRLETRLQCLNSLRKTGYAVGCGFMVGAPYQSSRDLAYDLKFIERFKPEMCGIGPFIPHDATPFGHYETGSAELTCFLLSIIRIIHPSILLPATTALIAAMPDGCAKGVLAGANVVMPNLSPFNARQNYELYRNKSHTDVAAREYLSQLEEDMRMIGHHICIDRGDPKAYEDIHKQS